MKIRIDPIKDGWCAIVTDLPEVLHQGIGVCGTASDSGAYIEVTGYAPHLALESLYRAIGIALVSAVQYADAKR